MTQALTENQTRWLAELRSGNYKQGKGALHRGDEFCCLGVAAKMFATGDTRVTLAPAVDPEHKVVSYDRNTAMAPPYVVEALGLHDYLGVGLAHSSLSSLNDRGNSFNHIADLIESDPGIYFKCQS